RCFFFFSSRRRHTRSKRDWSSDVCSSDLQGVANGRDSASNCLWEDNQARCGKETQSYGAGCFGLAYRDSIYPGPYCFSKKRCMIDREGNSGEDKEIHFKVRVHIDLQLAPEQINMHSY